MNFLDALRAEAGGRRRVNRSAIWHAFRRAHPVEATAGDARERLAWHLGNLAGVELPSPRGPAWDRSANPPIPEWIAIARPPGSTSDLHPASVPWAPELSFVPSTVSIDTDAALAVQRFLCEGGRTRPLVPMRERSVQLFGDEKRLDRLLRTPLFAEGRLDLATLRCFSMAPPLVFEVGAHTLPCLVVENHHTWWSFCAWNRRVEAWSAVVYGAGGAFGRDAVGFLAERCQAWGTTVVEYFGDLDRDGLLIPARAATWCAGRLTLVPAARWYRRLLALAPNAGLPAGAPIDADPESLAWLPPDVAEAARAWFDRGVRIPQELVGSEVLAHEAVDPRGSGPDHAVGPVCQQESDKPPPRND